MLTFDNVVFSAMKDQHWTLDRFDHLLVVKLLSDDILCPVEKLVSYNVLN